MSYLHLTLEERRFIEQKLKNHCSLQQIAKDLHRSPNTIRREILRHRTQARPQPHHSTRQSLNDCSKKRQCSKNRLCQDCNGPLGRCSICWRCNTVCSEFTATFCSRRDQAPWCCNACPSYRNCSLHKYYYSASSAHRAYLYLRSEARRGLACSEEEMKHLDRIFTPLIRQGQSIHAIYVNHCEEMFCSEKTLYRYIHLQQWEATDLDLPLKVKRKPFRKKTEHKVDKSCRIGRSYKDFLQWQEDNPGLSEVQIDTVEGSQNSVKVLLTLQWKKAGFMAAYLLDRQTAAQVNSVFRELQRSLGKAPFQRLFPVLLTDRGTEFSAPVGIECHRGEKWTSLFYCNPNQSQQKPNVENEHRMLRKIIPKGRNFDHLEQKDIQLAMSHITSYVRLAQQNRTPQEAFEFFYGESVAERFGLTRIEPDQVVLKPSLLPWPQHQTKSIEQETGEKEKNP